ncbi:beta-1,3-galactosyltransferase 2-like isoform X1 [Poeciliopsis prolifica]|uniref:beta-1,3-galactosyltransferase 2-like isoform X1 n=1 Tax=Poeciliopsis prolifica TaxID=188132 RepID=UPI0024131DF9|nr:beta-1,3-galactosyltransferase 2-like isoform X1 [Poeciliopsis prolifica]
MGDQDAGSDEGVGLRRQIAKPLHDQKLPGFRFWFQGLLMLCLLGFVVFLAFSDSTVPWIEKFSLQKQYRRFLNQSRKVPVPAYLVHPKHRAFLNKMKEKKTPIPEGVQYNTEPEPLQPQRLQYHEAYSRNYRFVMDNVEVCKVNSPLLVLMVPVAPSNVVARDAIRATWGKDRVVQGETVLTLFMLGLDNRHDVEKLQQENQQHNDLIQSNFLDTYLNLTIKTMVIMDWLATRCPSAAYAMKVDSDMFLNVDNLVIMLKKPGIPHMNYLTGMLMWNRPVVRDKNSKWYVPEEMFPDPQYPTYTLGMGYVFSNDLPAKFVDVSKSIKPFNIEDAYIGMCIKKLGLSPTSPPDPSQFKAYNSRYDRCEFSKIITYILGSSETLKNYWADFKKPGPHC